MFPNPIFLNIHMYGVMIAIGVLLTFTVLEKYGKKLKMSQKMQDFVFYDAFASIAVGFFSAMFFQSLYEFIKYPERGFNLNGDMTFLGGLIGGTVCFLVVYFVARKKLNENLSKVLMIAPCCITVTHGFGRLGCFCAGCCYGKPTDSWLGVKFPNIAQKVYPTQLFEAAFLFILFAILTFMLFKKYGRFNMPTYLICYGVFRFFIEFIRNDERGALVGNITPSQFWSLLMIVIGIIFIIFIVKGKKSKEYFKYD